MPPELKLLVNVKGEEHSWVQNFPYLTPFLPRPGDILAQPDFKRAFRVLSIKHDIRRSGEFPGAEMCLKRVICVVEPIEYVEEQAEQVFD